MNESTPQVPALPALPEEGGVAKEQPSPPLVLPKELSWLLDAPMFIDEPQVEAFYDSVLRPDYERTSISLEQASNRALSFEGGLEGSVGMPWLAGAKVSAKGGADLGWSTSEQATLQPISNAYRHLLALAIHYVSALPERVILADPAVGKEQDASHPRKTRTDWMTDAYIVDQVPRALLFIDLRPGTTLIPTALELVETGKVSLLFEPLGKALAKAADEEAPDYPELGDDQGKRDAYWRWFAERFSSRAAMEVIEATVHEKRIAWIDYRVPLGMDAKGRNAEPFLHLHMSAYGNYPTGSFAYNLVRRGHRHGLRIVGTLKSEPDLNVLAIFER
jgi:hypothetical protein